MEQYLLGHVNVISLAYLLKEPKQQVLIYL